MNLSKYTVLRNRDGKYAITKKWLIFGTVYYWLSQEEFYSNEVWYDECDIKRAIKSLIEQETIPDVTKCNILDFIDNKELKRKAKLEEL
jgi:hypothetical protein